MKWFDELHESDRGCFVFVVTAWFMAVVTFLIYSLTQHYLK